MRKVAIVSTLLSLLIACVTADTPANCTAEDVKGSWIFYEGERSGKNTLNCTEFQGPVLHSFKLDLLFPNIVVDELGHKGTWTVVYNQGFEVVINHRRYFAFSSYEKVGTVVTSYCNTTLPGWSHDVLTKNWACYNAQKVDAPPEPKTHYEQELVEEESLFQFDEELLLAINSMQNSWKATTYPELDKIPMSDYIRRLGGVKSRHHKTPSFGLREALSDFIDLPEEFDWRNVSGVNYVSPVRNQRNCGACYVIASLSMLESRLRIATNNTDNVTFSVQDVVSCSEYSQGCEGGFPYLVAGKYAQDFGVVPDSCMPYTGHDGECSENKCKRYYVADFHYVGGYYGGCSEDLMKLELVRNGPISVSFEVYDDFSHYREGIYFNTGLESRFTSFEIVNHSVLIVGYGTDKKTGEKYWIVKNDWGYFWGEQGYFRIRRGTNECNIESIAVAATIIP